MFVTEYIYRVSFVLHNNLVRKHGQKGNDLLKFRQLLSDWIGIQT